MRKPPDWDLLIVADEADEEVHGWFPAEKIFTVENLISLEGLRPRNTYLTNRALEHGSGNLFHALYFNARLTGGKVLHISDYRMEP